MITRVFSMYLIEYMPELEWYWGYPAIWLVMCAILVVMVVYFKRKNGYECI